LPPLLISREGIGASASSFEGVLMPGLQNDIGTGAFAAVIGLSHA
jgi:hypothetical protein